MFVRNKLFVFISGVFKNDFQLHDFKALNISLIGILFQEFGEKSKFTMTAYL